MIPAHKHLVQWGLDQGYTIEVCLENEVEYEGTSYDDAIEAITACDEGVIYFIEGTDTEGKPQYVAWFAYVFDHSQEPNEIIYDYGVNAISAKWDKAYDDFYYNCEVKYIYKPSNN